MSSSVEITATGPTVTSNCNGTTAAVEILHSICEEVMKGHLAEKRRHLEKLLQQTPPGWFHLGTKEEYQEEKYQELKDLCINVILLLINQTKDTLKSCHESDGSDDQDRKYKEYATSAHAAMTLIGLLLSKLRSDLDENSSGYQTLHSNPDENSSRFQWEVKEAESFDSTSEQREEIEKGGVTCPPASDGHQVGHLDGHDMLRGSGDVTGGGQPNRSNSELQSSGSHPVAFREDEGHFSIQPRNSDILRTLPRSILDITLKEKLNLDDSEERSEGSNRLLHGVIKSTIGPSITLCASHTQTYPWTSKTSLQAANDLLTQLTTLCGCNSISTLLSGCQNETKQHGSAVGPKRLISKGAFGLAMVELKQQLTRNDWKKYPAAKYTFTWLLAHVKHPYLGGQLDHCLPPSLLFVDDYQMENKILGIHCLKHIIENVDPTELRWYGRAEVVYEALHPLMYNHKPDLIDVLYPCMLAILRVVEKDPKKTDLPRKLGRYDKALQVILTNMEGEQRILVRQANARHLPSFIVAMGITILWHLKRLVRIIITYLETSDGLEETGRILTLRILQAVIVEAWPRMMSHCTDLMKSLLKLLLDISRGPADISSQVKDTVCNESVKCMILLKRCCGTVVEETVNKLLGSDLKDKFLVDCLERVQKAN